MECRGFESHPRQHLGKSDCLGCAVLLCHVCLFDLACFFLSSFSSLIKNMYSEAAYMDTCVLLGTEALYCCVTLDQSSHVLLYVLHISIWV